jgi:pantoate--beta-alanine ligase
MAAPNTGGRPRLFELVDEWLTFRPTIDARRSIGFVPTMGALHAGHASLIERARAECDVVVLSIFVNPTQFDDPDDLAAYPSTLDADLAIASACGVDHVLFPTKAQVYPDGYRYHVTETDFSNTLCGEHRPGHFDGVLTVVLKLLNIVRPARAYFGEKDYQQLTLVRDMVDALFVPTTIVPCPTVREDDGLALSSRNRRLSTQARELAPQFATWLHKAASADEATRELDALGFTVDYVVDYSVGGHPRRFGAVHLDGVRLIDNVAI